MDDITFCLSDCQRTDCYRHPSNIQDRTIPHSYADFKGTETCPEFATDINVPINDDTISRKAVIDAVHTATYGFICGAEDGDEITEADELVLSYNKAVCNAIKALPSVQPEQRYTEEELMVFRHGISLSLLSKRSSQHWQYDEETATEIKFLERLYEKVGADMRGEQDD